MHALRDYFADTHYATPMRALSLLDQWSPLSRHIAVSGYEPARHDAMEIGLSATVSAALDAAETVAVDWITCRVTE